MLNAIIFVVAIVVLLGGMFYFVFRSRKTNYHASVSPDTKALEGIAIGDIVGYRSRRHGYFSGLNLRLGEVIGFAPSGRAFIRLEDNGTVVRRQLSLLSVVSS